MESIRTKIRMKSQGSRELAEETKKEKREEKNDNSVTIFTSLHGSCVLNSFYE